jgi:putative NIF3 family GTP cyclohydrolase 1 type 2
MKLTRRQFAALGGGSMIAGSLASAQPGKLTAGEVVVRIRKNLGIPWDETTYRDTFKTGGPDTVVQGISSTFMSSLSVLQRSVKAGNNMIVTHEPTFWSDPDRIEPIKDDPMYKFKLDYANKNNIAIFRLHDHWHARKPDGIALGWNKRMNWIRYQVDGSQRLWKIPPTTIGELAKYVAKTLESRSVRVIGDASTPVTKVGRGGHMLAQNMEALQAVDCVIVSEAREYDSHEFFRDVVLSGEKKGAIIISHEAGEEAGMDEFASWLKPLVPEAPVLFVPTRDEFWTV